MSDKSEERPVSNNWTLLNQIVNLAIIIPLIYGAMHFSQLSTQINSMRENFAVIQADVKSVSNNIRSVEDNVQKMQAAMEKYSEDIVRYNDKAYNNGVQLSKLQGEMNMIKNCLRSEDLKSNFCRMVD